MGRRWMSGYRIAAFTMMACLGATALVFAQQFNNAGDRSRAMLEGNWQSCRQADGQYAERVYDGRWPGMEPFELHMGPYHDFALFRAIQDGHRDHDSPDNLLRPHIVEVVGNNGRAVWDVNGIHLEVVLAGGAREDCESWFVTLNRSKLSSH